MQQQQEHLERAAGPGPTEPNERAHLNWTPAAGSDGSGRLQRNGFGGIKAGAAQREVVTRPREAE